MGFENIVLFNTKHSVHLTYLKHPVQSLLPLRNFLNEAMKMN